MFPSKYAVGAAALVSACGSQQASPPLVGKPNPEDVLFTDLPRPAAPGTGGSPAAGGAVTSGGSGVQAGGVGGVGGNVGAGGAIASGGAHVVAAAGSSSTCDAHVSTRREARLRAAERMQPRIVGGHPEVLKWVAAITADGTQAGQFCGGSLIKKDWVLTAAHCDVQVGDSVIVGREDLRNVPADAVFKVKTVLTHAKFSRKTMDNDIALLHLASDASADTVTFEKRTATSLRNPLTVAGWGRTKEGGERSPILLAVDVPEISPAACRDAYPNTITQHMLCAGVEAKDSCQGDSGGPLAVKNGHEWTQVGIVSFGRGCGQANSYGVYTRVSDYAEFITACAR